MDNFFSVYGIIFTILSSCKANDKHWVKSGRIRSYSFPYFPAFGLNTDQNNSEYGHFTQ